MNLTKNFPEAGERRGRSILKTFRCCLTSLCMNIVCMCVGADWRWFKEVKPKGHCSPHCFVVLQMSLAAVRCRPC